MSMKKVCELCSNPASMFCDSDQASLCWDCDGKVHAANFLVAKHSRTLLCHVCSSPTPWKAAGPKLRPTVSVCQACENRGASSSTSRREDDEEDDSDSGSQESQSDDGEYDSDCEYYSDEEGEDDDGENQVVPWSISSSTPPPSPEEATAAASGQEDISVSYSKRLIRDYANFESEEEEEGWCSDRSSELCLSRFNFREYESNYGSSSSALSLSRPIKMQRTSDSDVVNPGGGQTQANSSERRRN